MGNNEITNDNLFEMMKAIQAQLHTQNVVLHTQTEQLKRIEAKVSMLARENLLEWFQNIVNTVKEAGGRVSQMLELEMLEENIHKGEFDLLEKEFQGLLGVANDLIVHTNIEQIIQDAYPQANEFNEIKAQIETLKTMVESIDTTVKENYKDIQILDHNIKNVRIVADNAVTYIKVSYKNLDNTLGGIARDTSTIQSNIREIPKRPLAY